MTLRHRSVSICVLISILATGIATAATTKKPADHRSGYLTAPSDAPAREIAQQFIADSAAEFGLSSADLSDLAVRDEYVSRHNGVTHVYVRQRLNGIDVVNGDFNLNIDRRGRVFFVGNRFEKGLRSRVNANSPSIGARGAIESAARHLELTAVGLELLQTLGGPSQQTQFSRGGISSDEIPVKLMYLPTDDSEIRLTWQVVLNLTSGLHWYTLFVDAVSGEVLEKFDMVTNEAGVCVQDCYDVIPLPAESPIVSPQTTASAPYDATASPFGWHDTDGIAGAEFTDTRGNNADAITDLEGANSPGRDDVRAEGGANLVFNDFWDPSLDPEAGTNKEASVTNLFYWNNIMHDITYQYGFDEASGNFQFNNYGNGGLGDDEVRADALDGSDTDNANFFTPPDGSNPRMQMFRFIAPPTLTINAPGNIAGEYAAGSASFGAVLDQTGITGDLALVNDGSTETIPPGSPGGIVTDGCQPLVGFTAGRIAVIDRGSCEFGLKVLNAENAGAIAAIVVNNQGDEVVNMGGGANGGQVTISSIFIGQSDGTTIKSELPGVNASLTSVGVDRDSDFDNGVIAHEYGHGISNRLTGGPANVNCLNNDEEAGEGWSDWWTLTLFADESDGSMMARGIGTYVSFEPADGPGIRNFPYSTDMTVNPQTYADIGTTNIPHGVGEIWAAMLWEMYWNLVARDGFDSDLYSGSGGNNLAIQLVVDGMKMQPCSPTFVQARDAILAADMANNGGANECEIWTGFAKRGLGFSADAGGTGVGDETEAFDLPAGIPAVCGTIFTDGFESGDTTVWSSTVP